MRDATGNIERQQPHFARRERHCGLAASADAEQLIQTAAVAQLNHQRLRLEHDAIEAIDVWMRRHLEHCLCLGQPPTTICAQPLDGHVNRAIEQPAQHHTARTDAERLLA
jgi:hypothetical protein